MSDGELVPAELVRRAVVKGLEAIAITDHVDFSNIQFVLGNLRELCEQLSSAWPIKVLPGVEITHVPPPLIGRLAAQARQMGALIVVVHGETVVEPVEEGTNLSAIEAGVDILAHPGLITLKEAELARERGVYLEISSRKGHCLTNGHLVKVAREVGAPLIIASDAHCPDDLIDEEMARKVGLGAGLSSEELERVFRNGRQLAGI